MLPTFVSCVERWTFRCCLGFYSIGVDRGWFRPCFCKPHGEKVANASSRSGRQQHDKPGSVARVVAAATAVPWFVFLVGYAVGGAVSDNAVASVGVYRSRKRREVMAVAICGVAI